MTDFPSSPETETLDAWVDSLPDDNGYWCGWHPVHGYGLHWGVRSSKSLIKLTEQNIKLGWEVRRVFLTDGHAQPAPEAIQEVAANAIRAFCQNLGANTIVVTGGVERIYYSGLSLDALAVAVALALSSPHHEASK